MKNDLLNIQALKDRLGQVSAKIRVANDLDEKNRLTNEYNQLWKRIGQATSTVVQSAEAAKSVQLDLFPEWENNGKAAMPNTIARSSLFASIRPGKRKIHDKSLIASRADATIKYSGKQLDMADSDTFLQAIRVIEKYDLGENIQIYPYAFLRDMGRGTGKKEKPGIREKRWLEASFDRLTAGTLEAHVPGQYRAVLHLIDEYIHDEITNTYYIRMNPKIIALFRKEQYGLIDWAARREMSVPLAKWLQTYVATNKRSQEHSIGLEKLKLWCGQGHREIRKFRTALQNAIDELLKLKVLKTGSISEKDVFHYKRS
ncbi:MAG: hypothetical protein GY718_09220 [Lentisphaerae bacterium]|nr:hypothetical protein [Lentisphaerota bacterium]